MTAAITPLIANGKMRSVKVCAVSDRKKPGIILAITYGNSGASMAKPASPHTTRLISAHSWRIILGLLETVKSAPLKPMTNAIGPIAAVRNIA